MMRQMRSLWLVISLLLPTIAACSEQRVQKTLSPAVTTLEVPQAAPVTQLEPPQSAAPSTTTLTPTQPARTTTTSVQQTLTALNAQRTSEGIRINLPEDILFDFDKSELRPSAKPTLTKLSLLINHYQTAPVSIYGHTDSKGSDDYNQSLSERRANAVRTYFVQTFGIKSARLEARGFGESKPVASNTKPDGSDDPQSRQKNRRVEVLIRNDGTMGLGNSQQR